MNSVKISIRQASLIFLGLLSVAAVIILLAGPLVPDDKQVKSCVVNLHLPIGGVSMNCDSPEFLRLATDPKQLFEPKNDRQARPGYIFAAWLVSRPFFPLTILAEKVGFKAMREAPLRFTRPLIDYFPAYTGYVLLNAFFLWFSARLFWGLFAEDKKISLTIFLLGLFFLANDIFFDYAWSPHTQVFNVFVPIFCLWAAYRAYQGGEFWRKNVFLISLLAGLGIMAYTNFCLFFPAIILGELLRERKITWGFLLRSLGSFYLLCLPLAAWFLIVFIENGSVYNHETACCGYGIWYQSKNIFDYVYKFFYAGYWIIVNLLTKNLYIFLAGILSWFFLWRKVRSSRPILMLTAAISLIFIIFLSALTFYPDRVLFSVASVWLVPTAILLKKNSSRFIVSAAAAYLLGWIVWMYFLGFGLFGLRYISLF